MALLGDVRRIAADPVHHHQRPFAERADGKGAIGVSDVMGDVDDLVGAGPEKGMPDRLFPLLRRKDFGHVLVGQALFQLAHGKDVAIAHHEIDVVERDALGAQTVVDHVLVEAGRVLVPVDPLLGDGEGDGAVAQETGGDVMVVGVDAENVGVTLGHDGAGR